MRGASMSNGASTHNGNSYANGPGAIKDVFGVQVKWFEVSIWAILEGEKFA